LRAAQEGAPAKTDLASCGRLWHTQRMKRLVLVIAAALLLGAIVLAVFMLGNQSTLPQAALPTPNGYDDLTAAAQGVVAWRGDLLKLPPEEMRAAVEQNSKVLEEVRRGLKKESAVPVRNDQTWLNQHMAQLASHKQMAQLLVAEGLVHLQEGRTNEAARAFADCIAFAHAAHRRGLMIDELLAVACQAIGARQLVQVAPQASPDALREILPKLIALDQSRETAPAILQRERDWSRGMHGTLRVSLIRLVTQKSVRAVESKLESRHAHSVASLRLVITELALRLHERENGKLPAALAELVPAKLPAVPVDPFSQEPLVYRPMTNSFLLYSLGPDGKDDGGASPVRGQPEKGDLLPSTP
jgi:hypothetical protein